MRDVRPLQNLFIFSTHIVIKVYIGTMSMDSTEDTKLNEIVQFGDDFYFTHKGHICRLKDRIQQWILSTPAECKKSYVMSSPHQLKSKRKKKGVIPPPPRFADPAPIETMKYDGVTFTVEGYWSPRGEGGYQPHPFVAREDEPWSGRDQFLRKARIIELWCLKRSNARDKITTRLIRRILKDSPKPYKYKQLGVIQWRGYSESRISQNKNKHVGSKEFYDKEAQISWPEAYVSHYMEEYNVLPTKRFFEYVQNFEL